MIFKSKRINSVIVLIVLMLIAYIIGMDIYRNADTVLSLKVDWRAFIFGVILIIVSQITVSFSIYNSIQALGATLTSPKEAMLVNIALQPTKYLPGGSLLNAVAQGIGLGKIEGISNNVAYAAPFLAIFLNFVSAIFLALLAYIISGEYRSDILLLLVFSNVVSLAFFSSKVRRLFLNGGNMFLPKRINDLWSILFNANPAHISRAMALCIVFWFLAGTGVFFIAVACSPISSDYFFMFFSAYILSVALGFLAVIFPGGIGVREGILIFLVGQFMPKPWPAVIALCTRIAWTIAEALAALCAVYILKNSKKAV